MRRDVLLSGAVVATWVVCMAMTGLAGRAADNLPAALTMVFGSFVAGSTPQGGGAVAFPVFTKLLGVAAADARTFSLSIQAIGMGAASLAIALTGRDVDRGALRLTVPWSIVGYLVGFLLFSVVAPPSAPLKVLFTLVVVAAGFATWTTRNRPAGGRAAVVLTEQTEWWIATAAVLGGLTSSLFGSGADVAAYLVLTIVLGLRPSIGVATSVVTMAAVSVVGLTVSLLTGALSSAPAAGVDVFGMWIAAIPVVVIGAPLGSWFASRVSPRLLVRFIAALAGLELLSTMLFLDELRTDPTLGVFAVVGLVLTGLAVGRAASIGERFTSPSSRRVRSADPTFSPSPAILEEVPS